MLPYRAGSVLRHCCPWEQVRYNASAIGLAARSIATKSPCDGKLCRRPQVLLRSFCFRATLSAPAVQSGCPRLVACSAAWTAIREATDGSHLSPPERAPRRSTDPRGVSFGLVCRCVFVRFEQNGHRRTQLEIAQTSNRTGRHSRISVPVTLRWRSARHSLRHRNPNMQVACRTTVCGSSKCWRAGRADGSAVKPADGSGRHRR